MPIYEVSKLLGKRQFSIENGKGFILQKARERRLEGTYIRRIELAENVNDPFGNEFINKTIRYESVEFILEDDAALGLEILNSPRSLGEFFNELSFVLDYKFVLKRRSIDINTWLSELEKVLSDVTVNRVVCTDIQLSKKTSASMSIAGQEDIRIYLKKYPNCRITRATFQYFGKHGLAKCELSHSMAAIYDKRDVVSMRKILKDTLSAIMG
jgi:hypothetical protein